MLCKKNVYIKNIFLSMKIYTFNLRSCYSKCFKVFYNKNCIIFILKIGSSKIVFIKKIPSIKKQGLNIKKRFDIFNQKLDFI